MSPKQLSDKLLSINNFRRFHSPLSGSVGGPEKAGVGGSIPSLATIIPTSYSDIGFEVAALQRTPQLVFASPWEGW
jgi:hypothetical protein